MLRREEIGKMGIKYWYLTGDKILDKFLSPV